MAAALYGQAILSALRGEYDLGVDTVKALLVTSAYIFDPDGHSYLSDLDSISGAEVSGTGYAAGGIALTGVSLTKDTANNKITLDADDAAFGTITITGAAGIILYVDKGTAATSQLMSFEALSPAVDVAGAAFTYVFPATGIGSLSY